jgi:hypothetical protein
VRARLLRKWGFEGNTTLVKVIKDANLSLEKFKELLYGTKDKIDV